MVNTAVLCVMKPVSSTAMLLRAEIPQALDLGVCSHEAASADVTASTTCSTVVPNTMHSYEPNYEAGSEKQAESEQLTDDPCVNPETMSVRPSWHERRRAR